MVLNLQFSFMLQLDKNRVGRGIAPSPSHTTTHALARGGFS
jgi:hypothetical protein